MPAINHPMRFLGKSEAVKNHWKNVAAKSAQVKLLRPQPKSAGIDDSSGLFALGE